MDVPDQSLKLNISVWMLTALSALFLSLRIGCKLMRNRGLWWDDHILIISWICLLLSVIAISINVNYGTGKHVWDVPVKDFGPSTWIGNIAGTLSIWAAILSKTSFAVTLLKLMKGGYRVLLWCIIGSINIFLGLSSLFLWVQCMPVQKAWEPKLPGSCWDKRKYTIYAIFAGSWSGFMDLALALLPWKIIWGLQIKTKEKIGIALAMSMGVFACATAIMKSYEITTMASGDFSWQGVGLGIWGSAESAVTIIAASIPVLRTLVMDIKHMSTKRSRLLSTTHASQASKQREIRSQQSDEHMLEEGGILQTSEVAIEYKENSNLERAGSRCEIRSLSMKTLERAEKVKIGFGIKEK